LLQVLDEGWLTDGEGQKVSFQHTIIVATSNVGSVHLTPKKQVGFAEEDSPDVHKLIMKELERAMRPELINRFDDLVMFNKLTKENYGEVFELRIAELRKRLDAQGLKLEVDPGVIDFLVASIDTDKYGARPLARKIQQELENPIAMMLISGAKPANGVIRASVAGDKLSIFSGA
jgi:ATP-dependent Clp protease ATP-binding subunit ClpA